MCIFLLETFRVKHCIDTMGLMGVTGVYSKSAKVPLKASASEAPEHRTAPLSCVGLKLSKGVLMRESLRGCIAFVNFLKAPDSFWMLQAAWQLV